MAAIKEPDSESSLYRFKLYKSTGYGSSSSWSQITIPASTTPASTSSLTTVAQPHDYFKVLIMNFDHEESMRPSEFAFFVGFSDTNNVANLPTDAELLTDENAIQIEDTNHFNALNSLYSSTTTQHASKLNGYFTDDSGTELNNRPSSSNERGLVKYVMQDNGQTFSNNGIVVAIELYIPVWLQSFLTSSSSKINSLTSGSYLHILPVYGSLYVHVNTYTAEPGFIPVLPGVADRYEGDSLFIYTTNNIKTFDAANLDAPTDLVINNIVKLDSKQLVSKNKSIAIRIINVDKRMANAIITNSNNDTGIYYCATTTSADNANLPTQSTLESETSGKYYQRITVDASDVFEASANDSIIFRSHNDNVILQANSSSVAPTGVYLDEELVTWSLTNNAYQSTQVINQGWHTIRFADSYSSTYSFVGVSDKIVFTNAYRDTTGDSAYDNALNIHYYYLSYDSSTNTYTVSQSPPSGSSDPSAMSIRYAVTGLSATTISTPGDYVIAKYDQSDYITITSITGSITIDGIKYTNESISSNPIRLGDGLYNVTVSESSSFTTDSSFWICDDDIGNTRYVEATRQHGKIEITDDLTDENKVNITAYIDLTKLPEVVAETSRGKYVNFYIGDLRMFNLNVTEPSYA